MFLFQFIEIYLCTATNAFHFFSKCFEISFFLLLNLFSLFLLCSLTLVIMNILKSLSNHSACCRIRFSWFDSFYVWFDVFGFGIFRGKSLHISIALLWRVSIHILRSVNENGINNAFKLWMLTFYPLLLCSLDFVWFELKLMTFLNILCS